MNFTHKQNKKIKKRRQTVFFAVKSKKVEKIFDRMVKSMNFFSFLDNLVNGIDKSTFIWYNRA